MAPREGKGYIGLVPLSVGLAVCCVAAFGDPREIHFPVGRLPLLLAGLSLCFAGLAMLINALDSRYRSVLLGVNGTAVLGSLLGVPLAVAWNAGERGPLFIAGAAALFIFLCFCLSAPIREFQSLRRR